MKSAMIQVRDQLQARPIVHEVRAAATSPSASRRVTHAVCLAMALVFLPVLPCHAQKEPPPYQQLPSQNANRSLEDLPINDPIERERQMRALNAMRHKAMVTDTNKLLKLAHELEDEVSRTSPDVLTPAQLKKVAEIEKLARSVKDKMSTSVQAVQENVGPYSPQHH